MRIIQNGRLPGYANNPITITCKNCGCIFEANANEYDVSEVRSVLTLRHDGFRKENRYIIEYDCPFCNTHAKSVFQMEDENNDH